MSQNIEQIYVANPATSMVSTDLMYLGRSPYSDADDFAITWANIMASITTVGTVTVGVWNATTIAIVHGGTGVTSVTTTPGASAWAGWDANSNMSASNFLPGFATTVTAAGNTILTVASKNTQEFTGSTTQTCTLPVVTTLVAGFPFKIINNSSGAVTVNSSGGNAIQVMAANTTLYLTCVAVVGTGAASWNATYVTDGAGVTSITGTANQVIASSSTGDVTLSLPQDIGTSSSPTFTAITASAGIVTSGASTGGFAGQFRTYSTTSSLGSLSLTAANNAGNYANVITNASTGQATTWTIPDPGASTASFILSSGTQSIGAGLSLTTPALGAATATSINFGGSTLANYVEGTFTPALESSGGGAPTYTTQTGTYTRIGNRVFYTVIITLATTGTLGAGTLSISGMPVIAVETTPGAVIANALGATAATMLEAYVTGTNINLFKYAAGSATALADTDLTGTSVLWVSGNYRV